MLLKSQVDDLAYTACSNHDDHSFTKYACCQLAYSSQLITHAYDRARVQRSIPGNSAAGLRKYEAGLQYINLYSPKNSLVTTDRDRQTQEHTE